LAPAAAHSAHDAAATGGSPAKPGRPGASGGAGAGAGAASASPGSASGATLQTATPQLLAFPDEPFRATQPSPEAVRPFQLPAVKTFALPSGLQVYLVEQHALPSVTMDLNFDGGAFVDPPGKQGLAGVCMDLVTESTKRLDKVAYREALADTASTIASYATNDTQGLTLTSLSKHLPSTFALFAETLREPGLREADFARIVRLRTESLKQSRATPAAVASRVVRPIVFGPAHPFGAVPTETSLSALSVRDCEAHVSTWIRPKNARLFVVGDVTEAGVRALFAGPTLAGWTGRAPTATVLTAPPKPATLKGRIFLVNMPGAAQSQVAYVQFGPRRSAADYLPTTIMASVLGGGFAGRLNMNLREDKGYSYGAYGRFSYNRLYSTFFASASVRTDATYASLLEIGRELTALATGQSPPTGDELTREKAGETLGLPSQFATARSALERYRELAYFGLPLDYYRHYIDSVARVDAAQVADAARRHLRPGEGVYIVVGDGSASVIERTADQRDAPLLREGKPVTLRQALESLAASASVGGARGEVVTVDADGQPAP